MRPVEMTPVSGIDVDAAGRLSVGCECFFAVNSGDGTAVPANQAVKIREIPAGSRSLAITSFSAAARPPRYESGGWFRRDKFYPTDFLLRIYVARSETEWGVPVLSLILKTTKEPANVSGWQPDPHEIPLTPEDRFLVVEFQQAGAGNSPVNPSNAEFHITGIFS